MSNSNPTNARKTSSYVHFITLTGILSAAAFVLQLIEFPIPLMPSFIKLDFSDLPALLGAFSAGPLSGVLIELIKNLLHCTVSGSFGVGELSNFILGAIFVGTAGLMYKRKKTKKSALIASITGAIVMGALSFVTNLYVVYPVYYNFMPKEVIVAAYQAILPSVDSIEKCLLIFNVPFTIVKGFLNVILCFLIYKPLSPILKGRH